MRLKLYPQDGKERGYLEDLCVDGKIRNDLQIMS